MPSEVFRFLVTRPVQRVTSAKARTVFAPYDFGGESDFLRAVTTAATAKDMWQVAGNRLASSEAVFRRHRPLIAVLMGQPSDEPATLEQLRELARDLADELLAGTLAGFTAAETARDAVRVLQLTNLARGQVGSQRVSASARRRILRARIVLPRVEPAATSTTETGTSPASTMALEPRGSTAALRVALDELQALGTARAFRDEHAAPADESRRSYSFFGGRSDGAQPPPVPSPDWRASLSAESRRTLTSAGIRVDDGDLDAVVQEASRNLARQLAPRPDSGAIRPRAFRLGSSIGTTTYGIGSLPGSSPGTPPADDGLDAPATTPQTRGTLARKRRGDLFIVRQTLDRYDLGEIAHIENVLKGESNSRTFTRSQTSEDILVSSTESTLSEEKDLQSTERFELSSETKETIKDDLQLEAGFSVTASYGPTVGVEAGTNVSFEHAQDQSKEAASNYAREITNRAQSKVEQRISETRTSRVLREVEEITVHGIDNTGGPGHVQGVYRWVDKVYRAQLVNYGIRDLYDFYVPEPAAFHRHVRAGLPVEGVSIDPPSPPLVDQRPLMPADLDRTNYQEWLGAYGVTDAVPPPPVSINVTGMLEKGVSQGDDAGAPGSKVTTEIATPDGYVTTHIKVNGYGHQAADGNGWTVVVGGRQFTRGSADGEKKEFGGRSGTLPAALVYWGYDALSVGVSLSCTCRPEHFEKWQLATFAAITQGFQRLKSQYDEQVARARDSVSAGIHGRNPRANEKVVRDELKRAVISVMTGQRFGLFDAMRPSAPPHGYPEIAFADAAAEGDYVAFTEQAFEWENMTFLFYPYFWGRKAAWPGVSQLEDPDYLFEQFLKAGFARVQLPVRPGFESRVDYAFSPANPGGHLWPGEDPPGFGTDGLTLEEEMRLQTGGANFVQGPGVVTTTAGNAVIVGDGTEFSDDDLDRELRIDEATYRVVEVLDATHVRVAAPAPAVDALVVPYGIGAKLAGLSWEINVPTSLVYLQPDAQLNP